jgi:hypothetical protein
MMHTQIYIYQYVRHDLREEIVRDFQFIDDDDCVKMTLYLTEFMLKAKILDARPIKR